MKTTTLCFLMSLILVGCNQSSRKNETESNPDIKSQAIPVEVNNGIGNGAGSIEELFIKQIENAHKKDAFLKNTAVQFDLNLYFGGKQRMDGTITMLTNSSKIKIIKKDESQLLFDGQDVYLHPADANSKGARFDMFTWTYFFGFPYKLNDPGTQWKMEKDRVLKNKTYATAKLSFEKGTGDAPDDWYIAFANPETKVLQAAAYIVTYGSDDISKSESDPHIILYEDYEEIDGIPLATKWKFYGWNSENGLTEELGKASLSNIHFIENTDNSLFEVPENSKVIPSP